MSHPVADGLGDGVRLLEDLLEHEGLVAGLLGSLVVPVELGRLVLDGSAVRLLERRAVGSDRHDLAVAGELDDARLAEECGRVGREEHLVVAHADDQRHLMASAHEEPGMVVMDHDEGEVALEPR